MADAMWVVDLPMLPAMGSRWGRALNRRLVSRQFAAVLAALRLGTRRLDDAPLRGMDDPRMCRTWVDLLLHRRLSATGREPIERRCKRPSAN